MTRIVAIRAQANNPISRQNFQLRFVSARGVVCSPVSRAFSSPALRDEALEDGRGTRRGSSRAMAAVEAVSSRNIQKNCSMSVIDSNQL